MSRITKELARHIANKMVEDKVKYIQELRDNFKIEVRELYLDKVPKNVLKFLELNREYVNKTTTIKLIGNGFNHDYVHFETKDAVPSNTSNYPYLELDDKQGKKLSTLHNKICDLQTEVSKLKSDIENALYSLRTFKKVEENFKEAVKYLPKNVSYVPVVNLDSIKERLKDT